MNTYCAVYELNPEKVDKYIELHANCWPEQIRVLRESGAENLEIFINGTQCIITYECEDFYLFIENLSKNETNAKWQKRMEGFFISNVNLTGNQRIEPTQKVFSLKKELEGQVIV